MAVEHTLLLILQALCLAGAAVGLAATDWSLNKPQRWGKALTHLAGHLATAALCLLWISALFTLWQDLGHELPGGPLSRKVITSVALEGLLSLNGVFMLRCLHDTLRSGSPALAPVIQRSSAWAQACGAVWLMGAYFAVAHPLTGQWALSGLALALAALLVLAALAVQRLLRRLAANTTAWSS